MTDSVNPNDDLRAAYDHRRRLLTVCQELIALAEEFVPQEKDGLEQNAHQIESDAFRVMVVGDFKRGKSTLINALLGDKILPSFAVPTTAVVTEVRYGDKPAVRLWPTGAEQPELVPVDQLAERIRINVDNPDHPTPYELAEVTWPIELCRNGVIIIDTPGLNEHPVRQATTLNHLRRSDAIIVVQDAMTAMSMQESNFIEAQLPDYDLLFAFNKINLIDVDGRDEVITNVRRHVARLRGELPRKDDVFFVDAKGGLAARVARDAAGWTDSGMEQFHKGLANYLLTQRRRAKIFVRAQSLQRAAHAMERVIPEKLHMLDTHGAQLAADYDREKEPLADLEKRANQLKESLTNEIGGISEKLRHKALVRIKKLSEEMPATVAAVRPSTRLSINPMKIKSTAEGLATEIAEKATHEAHLQFNVWVRGDLAKFIDSELNRVSTSLADLIAAYQTDLDRVRSRLTGVEGEQAEVDKLVEQVVSGFGSDVRLATEGVGPGKVVTPMMQQFMAAWGLVLVSLFTPFGLVFNFAFLLGGALVADHVIHRRAADRLTAEITKRVGRELESSFRNQAGEAADAVKKAFMDQLLPIADSITRAMTKEIDEVRSEVESVLKIKQAGEKEAAAKRLRLHELDRRLGSTMHKLDGLLSDVALA